MWLDPLVGGANSRMERWGKSRDVLYLGEGQASVASTGVKENEENNLHSPSLSLTSSDAYGDSEKENNALL